ncbi:15155_t:CDS:1, partial [Cetraspora pellucida]
MLKEKDPLANLDKLRGYTLISKPKYEIRVTKIKNSKFAKNINKIKISGADIFKKESELDKLLA